jgi:large subunit ribosomal protein L6
MSRVGIKPITIPSGVSVKLEGVNITVSGEHGTITRSFLGKAHILIESDQVKVEPLDMQTESRAMWGTVRSIISNMFQGVSDGFTTDLEIIGVGYKASSKDGYINLALGKSHNTKIFIPDNIKVTHQGTKLTIFSYDKEKLGQFVAQIIQQRPPEPYKGKGIRKSGQYIERKESKKK